MCNNAKDTSSDLLTLDDKLKIHQRHLRFLAILTWKTYTQKNIPQQLEKGVCLLVQTQTLKSMR